MRGCGAQTADGVFQRDQMPRARKKRVFSRGLRAHDRQDFSLEQLDAGARKRREPDVAPRSVADQARFRMRRHRSEIGFVMNNYAR